MTVVGVGGETATTDATQYKQPENKTPEYPTGARLERIIWDAIYMQ